ncbi:hypothetical protein G3I76_54530, partial [Streptomyces sp. SID11233]|nr:hypothetical protein [Streptomyces sp. SID11233]
MADGCGVAYGHRAAHGYGAADGYRAAARRSLSEAVIASTPPLRKAIA